MHNNLIHVAKYADLRKNRIDTIDDLTFGSLHSLKELIIEDNNLTKINRFTFAGLFRLHELDLSGNQIHTIESGSFVDLKKLKKINLNYNRLKVLQDHVFAGTNHLKVLFIASNRIEGFGNYLNTLTSLTELDLEDNFISDIDLVKFAQLPNLLCLDLSRNRLNLDDANVSEKFLSESSLEELDIGTNLYTYT